MKEINEKYYEQVSNPDLFQEMDNTANQILREMAANDALAGVDTNHYKDTKRALDSLLGALKSKYMPKVDKEIKEDPAK